MVALPPRSALFADSAPPARPPRAAANLPSRRHQQAGGGAPSSRRHGFGPSQPKSHARAPVEAPRVLAGPAPEPDLSHATPHHPALPAGARVQLLRPANKLPPLAQIDEQGKNGKVVLPGYRSTTKGVEEKPEAQIGCGTSPKLLMACMKR